MSRYVIESGVSHHGSAPMWTVVRRNYSDPTLAFSDLWEFALSMPVLYRPDGGRKLRVREVKT